jgi:hypothetical protein
MTKRRRCVITPDVAVELAASRAAIASDIELLAPTLFRSEALSLLYRMVRSGDISEGDAADRLDYIRGLKPRLLGDRVLQDVAWRVADSLDAPDTLMAEYIALTRLQADALVTDDPEWIRAAEASVATARSDQIVR